MTEADKRERRPETDEAVTNVRYSDETLNDESRDREVYDRDADGGSGPAGRRSEGVVSYTGPDEARTRADEAEQELADHDQARSDVDRSDLDRSEASRSGARATDLDTADLNTTELAQPGAPTPSGGLDRSGYDATASRAGGGNVSVVDDPDALMRRWQEVQIGFVDDPRHAVQDADGLVQQVMQQVGQRLASERASLEQVWSRGGDVSTEDLRNAMQQYRSFFNRLLHV